jgi:Lipopolysaccharide kinase (Kdo/WaaP) family
VKPENFANLQSRASPFIRCNRPDTAEAEIPVTLLFRGFAQFVDDCKAIIPEKLEHDIARELSRKMCKFYTGPKGEKERLEDFQNVFSKHGFKLNSSAVGSTRAATDLATGDHSVVICVIEGEGKGGSEPMMLATLYYAKSNRNVAELYPGSPLPCMILYLFGVYSDIFTGHLLNPCTGGHVGFAGAVFTDRPNVELLVPPLSFFAHSTNSEMQDIIPRYIGAFLKLIDTLWEYYEAIHASPPLSDTTFLFPYPREFTSLVPEGSHQNLSFRYLRKLHPDKLVFHAMQENDHICVKFVRRYSVDAHAKCATISAAPALRGYEKLPGGWFMVVMDFLDEESYEHVSTSHDSRFPAIQAAIEQFHQAGFVHGDLRGANILVRKGDGPLPIAILDFDWSGKPGEIFYPFRINRQTVQRPNGVYGGKPILVEHDIEMLRRLFNGTDNAPIILDQSTSTVDS